ncbi:diguanylate cyclase [bacterium]|nr:diguanylate cyclase [bacterium]
MSTTSFLLKLGGVQLENIYTIADGLRENLREARYLSHAGQSLSITVSIGVAIISKETPSAEYALENARQACGQAKRRGQNQTQIFVVESDVRMARDLEAGWACPCWRRQQTAITVNRSSPDYIPRAQ